MSYMDDQVFYLKEEEKRELEGVVFTETDQKAIADNILTEDLVKFCEQVKNGEQECLEAGLANPGSPFLMDQVSPVLTRKRFGKAQISKELKRFFKDFLNRYSRSCIESGQLSRLNSENFLEHCYLATAVQDYLITKLWEPVADCVSLDDTEPMLIIDCERKMRYASYEVSIVISAAHTTSSGKFFNEKVFLVLTIAQEFKTYYKRIYPD